VDPSGQNFALLSFMHDTSGGLQADSIQDVIIRMGAPWSVMEISSADDSDSAASNRPECFLSKHEPYESDLPSYFKKGD
jgi:hypothetical protein